ncbi:MAG: BolA family protein [Pseudomonadota bacterium]
MKTERSTRIHDRLAESLNPAHLLVKDQSHLHAGHAGAEDGRGHFDVNIVSDAFEGKSRIQRHRIVFDALGDMMQTDIHALSITARTPAE